VAQRIEWRFPEQSLLAIGNWYLDWGDPERERLVTLSDLIKLSDNPAWCIREHADILGRVVAAVDDLLADLLGLSTSQGEVLRLVEGSPMAFTAVRAYQALQHAIALLVDALVECRKGALEELMRRDPMLSSTVAFALSDAMNGCYRLALHFPAQVME